MDPAYDSRTETGLAATGIGGLAVLWSDPAVFSAFSEAGGNMVMALVAEAAARLLAGREFSNPLSLTPVLAEELEGYACAVSQRNKVAPTFLLNCLVSLDFALWNLLALEKGTEDFGDLLQDDYRRILSGRSPRVARVPLLSYGIEEKAITRLAEEGCGVFKIKLGHPGNQREMLEKDKTRLSFIHDLLKDRSCPHTDGGRILYYLDANQRYESEPSVLELLEYADKIGMLDRTAVLEEPYPEDTGFSVANLPLLVAADESIHDVNDVTRMADRGFRALALKPAGKTMSLSLVTAARAQALGISCFVADSACVPLLVDWNKVLASRLDPLPGMKYPILESNGEEHYRDWDRLLARHPAAGSPWILARDGFFQTGEEFFRVSGGVFRPIPDMDGLQVTGFIALVKIKTVSRKSGRRSYEEGNGCFCGGDALHEYVVRRGCEGEGFGDYDLSG